MDITKPGEYTMLKTELDKIEDTLGLCLNRLFYLAIPSQVFSPIVRALGKGHLNDGCQHSRAESRLLIEKPFGYDLVSARELIQEIGAVFSEKQVYRIDHYLAKETVQNILTFRLQNPLFSSVWNRQHISHIKVVAAESIGIEGRINFYEQIGALRDIIQSHLLQIAALITMELPPRVSPQTIHAAKLHILKTFQPPFSNRLNTLTVRGQYQGYRQEVSQPNSQTETFAALRITSTDPVWKGVPIVLQTGKQLTAKLTEATVVFKGSARSAASNQLTVRIQPEEGMTLSLQVKQPGFATATENVAMHFSYGERVDIVHADPYE
jgi:glucose-6-phosphate 1-dehydrogenase